MSNLNKKIPWVSRNWNRELVSRRPYIYIYPVWTWISRPFQGGSVMRLSLGRRLVSLLPVLVAQRTRLIPSQQKAKTLTDAFWERARRDVTKSRLLFVVCGLQILENIGSEIRLIGKHATEEVRHLFSAAPPSLEELYTSPKNWFRRKRKVLPDERFHGYKTIPWLKYTTKNISTKDWKSDDLG